MWKLKAQSQVIDLVSDSEMATNVVEHSSKPAASTNEKTIIPSVKKEKTDRKRLRVKTAPTPAPVATGAKKRTTSALLQEKWAPHEGRGSCRGSGMPCVMGVCGAAAPAGPNGLCDLCNLDDIALLHQEGEGRLTHLLLQLASTEADLALSRIAAVDETVAMDLRKRMQRARRRQCPTGPPAGVGRSHKGHGPCQGVQDGCDMGLDGQPAAAGPDGLCDLCNLNNVASLHKKGNGRLTHLLLQLTQEQADTVLDRIKQKDESVSNDLRMRMMRARQRKNPDRPRRGPRKPRSDKVCDSSCQCALL